MANRPINPPQLADTATDYGVAYGVVAGNILTISGQASVDRELNLVGETFVEQTRVVFDSFTVTLEEAGFAWDDVVKINAFVSVNEPEALGDYCAILKEYLRRYSSKESVGHTYVVVKALALPGVLIEIDGMAVKS
ncbi:MAG: RidA family protein [Thermoleophilia bacterium]|nr:RidA family protein [Thermoleophilia bacterium]